MSKSSKSSSSSSSKSSSSKSNNLISNTDKTNTCNDTYCGSLLEKKINNTYLKHEKQVNDFIKKSKGKKFKNKMEKKMFKIMTKKISDKEKNKSLEDSKQQCKALFCNVGCKDTLLEPNSLSKKYIKDNKIIIDILKKSRKELFGNKTTVLDNNFYNKLPKKTITKLSKKGAISMCSDYYFEKVWP